MQYKKETKFLITTCCEPRGLSAVLYLFFVRLPWCCTVAQRIKFEDKLFV